MLLSFFTLSLFDKVFLFGFVSQPWSAVQTKEFCLSLWLLCSMIGLYLFKSVRALQVISIILVKLFGLASLPKVSIPQGQPAHNKNMFANGVLEAEVCSSD